MTTARSTSRILDEPLASAVLVFGFPLALGMGLQTTFNLVDAWLIARLPPDVSGPSLGAIGICDQIAALGSIVSYGISTATAALVAQAAGRGDRDEARRLVAQSLWLVAAWALVFGVAGAAFAESILRDVVGAKGQVAVLGASYLRVMLGGSASIFFLLELVAVLRALGSSKTPAALMVAANVVNLVLAVVLVFGQGAAPAGFGWGGTIAAALHLPRLGLLGAAWATVIARLAVLAPLAVIVATRLDLLDARLFARLDRVRLRAIVRVAWPSSTQLVVRIVAMLVTHALVARAFTTETDQRATTALGIVFRLETMALFVGLGWGNAAQTFVGQNLGARRLERAARSGWVAAAYDAVAMVALIAAYRAWGGAIVAFFDADPVVVASATTYLRFVAPSYVALGVAVVLGSAITGASATRTTLLVDLGVTALVQVPLQVAVVTLHPTPEALFAVVAATYVANALVYVAVYRDGRFVRALRA